MTATVFRGLCLPYPFGRVARDELRVGGVRHGDGKAELPQVSTRSAGLPSLLAEPKCRTNDFKPAHQLAVFLLQIPDDASEFGGLLGPGKGTELDEGNYILAVGGALGGLTWPCFGTEFYISSHMNAHLSSNSNSNQNQDLI